MRQKAKRGVGWTLVRGLVAGAAGTAAMTAHQTVVSKLRQRQSGDDSVGEQEETEQKDPWESAPAPAKVAKRALGLVGVEDVPAERIPTLTNAMHWLYGTAWGAAYAGVDRALRPDRRVAGPLFGTGVWAASYAQLVPLGLYEPPWRYSLKTVANDLGYHVTYGTTTALAYAALPGR